MTLNPRYEQVLRYMAEHEGLWMTSRDWWLNLNDEQLVTFSYQTHFAGLNEMAKMGLVDRREYMDQRYAFRIADEGVEYIRGQSDR